MLISFVLPVYGVREYLGECLDSVLGQVGAARPDPGIEAIAVDDASPDGCADLLDERARADSRLTVIHCERNLGPGNARNVGLARAAGDYVWFVDGDDVIPAGAVASVASALARDQPDVLLIDYQELFPGGRSRPSTGAGLLRAAPGGRFTLADAPGVINLTMTSWSKLFRREFLIGLNEPFRPGIHEDIPVTCAALLAGRLSALGEVCYGYRRSRRGSFMATTSTDHLAVFDAYDEVFCLLDKRAAAGDPVVTGAVRSAMFERAIMHYASVLQAGGAGIGPVGRPGLVPRRERRRFFHRMHAEFARHVPDGYRLPPGARGAKLRLIQRDTYATYELLEPLNRLRVVLRRR
jgi:CDP-glycerol glycerophosphotransferase